MRPTDVVVLQLHETLEEIIHGSKKHIFLALYARTKLIIYKTLVVDMTCSVSAKEPRYEQA